MDSDALGKLDRRHVFHPYTSIAAQQADGPSTKIQVTLCCGMTRG